jgi:hypothetical protein
LFWVPRYDHRRDQKGPLPIDKALDYAGQILEALDAAHKKASLIGI